jgi:hypothetical protein
MLAGKWSFRSPNFAAHSGQPISLIYQNFGLASFFWPKGGATALPKPLLRLILDTRVVVRRCRPGLSLLCTAETHVGSEEICRRGGKGRSAHGVLEGLNHYWMIQDPEGSAAVLTQFLNSLGRELSEATPAGIGCAIRWRKLPTNRRSRIAAGTALTKPPLRGRNSTTLLVGRASPGLTLVHLG